MSFIEYLTEKLMIFGRSAYPKFGHAVIIAGGAASGKGFQFERLMGISGKVFDVDQLKGLAIKSTKFAARVKEETGQDIKTFDLKKPENVSKLHEILAGVYNLPKKHQALMFGKILTMPADKKPNLIFDVTLKERAKLESISRNLTELGYDKKKIHLVWVVNDMHVAKLQNLTRDRVVPEEILIGTHEGAALTMKWILDMGDILQKYLDGSVYISFNRVGVDTELAKSTIPDKNRPKKSLLPLSKQRTGIGSYVTKADYLKVKEPGKQQLSSTELPQRALDKIREYTPDINTW